MNTVFSPGKRETLSPNKIHRISGRLKQGWRAGEFGLASIIDQFDDRTVYDRLFGWKPTEGDFVYVSFKWDEQYEEWEIVRVERKYPPKYFPTRSYAKQRKFEQRIKSLKEIEAAVLALRNAVIPITDQSNGSLPGGDINPREAKTIRGQVESLNRIYERMFRQCYSKADLRKYFGRTEGEVANA